LLHAGEGAHLLWVEFLVQRRLGGDGAFVAIAERFIDWDAVLVEPYVVDCPSIDSYGTNAFDSDFCGIAQAVVDSLLDRREVPSKAAIRRTRLIFKTMDEGDLRFALKPAQKGNTTTLGAKVNRDKCALV
jgi:hypothetical protein